MLFCCPFGISCSIECVRKAKFVGASEQKAFQLGQFRSCGIGDVMKFVEQR